MEESTHPTLFEREEPPEPPAPPVVEVHEELEQPEQDDLVAQPSVRERRNPWLIVLWLIGVVLTIAGLWGLIQAAERAMDPSYVIVDGYGSEQYRVVGVEDFYVIPAILVSLSPWFTALGIGSIIAASTVHAVQWSRRG